MPTARLLAKFLATTASLSGGAMSAARVRPRPEGAPPELVGELSRLVAETIASRHAGDVGSIEQLDSALTELAGRYGTLGLALDALGSGRRRHPMVAADKAHAWSTALSARLGEVEAVLRKHPPIMLVVSKWLSSHGDSAERLLDAYSKWLDAPDAGHAPPAPQPAHPEPEPAAHKPPGAPSDGDAALIRRLILDHKPLGESAGPPRLPAVERQLVERALADPSPLARAVGAIASGKFEDFDSLSRELRAALPAAEFWTLNGDQFYFRGRFDEAAEAYRSARRERDDVPSRLNLASALIRSRRPTPEAATKEAIDLLTTTLSGLAAESPMLPRLRGMLGSAWLAHHGGDRDANLRRAIEHLEWAIGASPMDADPRLWAQLHGLLGQAWQSLPSGKRAENLQRAITCYARAEHVWTREADPDRWAVIQNALGHCWEALPTGHRGVNLKRAMDYFNAALEVRTREANPIGWATLQNNLGNAAAQLVGQEHRQHIERAIACHSAALEVWSEKDRRAEWATTQNNLGNCWALLPASGEDRVKNLRRAMSCHKAALEVRTRASSPADWAASQNNLGSAMLHLGNEGGPGTVREAIACFQRALEVRTREAYPLDWAKTQANLGQAWTRLSEGSRLENLKNAAECYRSALLVLKPDLHPHQHHHLKARLDEVMDQMDELQLTT